MKLLALACILRYDTNLYNTMQHVRRMQQKKVENEAPQPPSASVGMWTGKTANKYDRWIKWIHPFVLCALFVFVVHQTDAKEIFVEISKHFCRCLWQPSVCLLLAQDFEHIV